MSTNKYDKLIKEDSGELLVDRSIYIDQEVFNDEIKNIFESTWNYVAHESQIKEPGDYFSTHIGHQPIFIVRKADGTVSAFLNACSHRGATLVPFESGNSKAFRCRFHGWTFNSDGKCLVIKNQDTGGYVDPKIKEASSLTPVSKLSIYRGFIFASLSNDVPELTEWLKGSSDWIDCLVDQSPDGLEIIKGKSTYRLYGNWKLQAENGVDGYHVSTVHRVFASTISNRESKLNLSGLKETEAGRITGEVLSGSYGFGNGHMGIWTERSKPTAHPIWNEKDRIDRMYSKSQAHWMLYRTRNLYVFPNVFIMDNPSTQVRTMRPLSPDVCDVTVRCIAPVGESKEARSARIRKFEDFYLTSGMATSDDLAALESVHEGSKGSNTKWNNFARGANATLKGYEGEDYPLPGTPPDITTKNWDHESIYKGFYRNWKDMISKDSKK